MNREFLALIDTIVRDKGIDREVLIQAIEQALASAAKKGVGKDAKEMVVTIDRERGDLTVMLDGKRVPSAEFSRIGAQTAKQVIMQKIREAERDVIFGEFQTKAGSIVSGTVHRFERGDIIIDLGRAEGILRKSERIPYEEYRPGDQVQAYVLEVRKGVKGTEIILSRSHEGFICGLLALEVPEISDGTLEIKALSREPGDRTKIAVYSRDEKVDAVGACVGMRGTRVKNIVRELHGEKIDIIRWQAEIGEYIAAALAPAKIAEIRPDEQRQEALVIVDDDQLSLAIGKKGQNVRLASKLTGWQLEIKSRSQLFASGLTLAAVRGVGPSVEERLREGGIGEVEQLAGASLEHLSGIKGIGEKTAEKLIEAAKEAIDQANRVAAEQAAAAEAAAAPSEAAESAETEAAEPVGDAPSEDTGTPASSVQESSEPGEKEQSTS